MHLSGYTYSFDTLLQRGQMNTADCIRYLATLGLRHVEVTLSYVAEDQAPAIENALRETQTRVACCDLVCDVVTVDETLRTHRVAEFQQRLGLAAQLGAPLVLVIPGLPRIGIAYETARRWFAEALRASLPQASRLGITLMTANVGWQPVTYGSSDQILKTCQAVGPKLKVTYDVGNYLLCGEDTLEALGRVASHVAHVHFKDWEVLPDGSEVAHGAFPGSDGRIYRSVPLGRGVVDLRGALAKLRDLNYQGAISVEYEGSDDPRAAVEQSASYLRSLCSAAGVT